MTAPTTLRWLGVPRAAGLVKALSNIVWIHISPQERQGHAADHCWACIGWKGRGAQWLPHDSEQLGEPKWQFIPRNWGKSNEGADSQNIHQKPFLKSGLFSCPGQQHALPEFTKAWSCLSPGFHWCRGQSGPPSREPDGTLWPAGVGWRRERDRQFNHGARTVYIL